MNSIGLKEACQSEERIAEIFEEWSINSRWFYSQSIQDILYINYSKSVVRWVIVHIY